MLIFSRYSENKEISTVGTLGDIMETESCDKMTSLFDIGECGTPRQVHALPPGTNKIKWK